MWACVTVLKTKLELEEMEIWLIMGIIFYVLKFLTATTFLHVVLMC